MGLPRVQAKLLPGRLTVKSEFLKSTEWITRLYVISRAR